MKYILLNVTLFFLSITILLAQPAIQWDKTIGSPSNTTTFAITKNTIVVQTSDGGYIFAQVSNAGIAGDKTENSRGERDFWIVKVSANGTKQWDKTIGGPDADYDPSIHQTTDGGFIIGGTSGSSIGGEKSESSRGLSDYWVVKLDQDGNKAWDKTIGSTDSDYLVDVQQTSDGGYILGGWTNGGIGGDKTEPALEVEDHWRNCDYWIVKLSPTGNIVWDKTLGTPDPDRMRCMTLTSDGGFIFAGGDESWIEYEDSGYRLMKVAASGTKVWEKVVQGTGSAEIHDIEQTPDGGFILGGTSNQRAGGDQAEDSHSDYWIVKLNADLTVAWTNLLNTLFYDDARGPNYFADLAQTSDGGYAVLGYSSEPGLGDKSENSRNGTWDYWLVKLNASGTQVWDKVLGGGGYDNARAIISTADGGLLLAGNSNSDAGFEKTDNKKGLSDLWIVKLAPEPPLPVRLASFTARKELSSTSLSWQTSSETQSDHFEIEHSVNAKTWNHIASVNALGESEVLHNYHFTHVNPANGNNYYRLKMVDTDGSFTYSKAEQVSFQFEFDVNVYPNPVAEYIHVEAADWSKVKGLQVLNNQGKALYSSGSRPSYDISARSLAPGLYFIKVTLTDGSETTRKIVVGQ
ncbi:T9SS type A sorting domain-containing protein [Dyadobacter sandarakinus]|uniref:T9SS type A sorting domain-containing protein n=1 Tax=Dyadobacter sandarakinus TaxID=2747268 RepID=A0ABX7I5R0_9BACT|nr:T9SS type A sorting domain-containing protein [Dyadobacter sandarakinus]QRR01436.1 T9SS type A sorting domain-containing protein [Dyadobacter sandarakinus]